MKKILSVLLAVLFAHLNTIAVYAKGGYLLLEPLPGFEEVDHAKFVDYITALYSLAIWIAGFCAMTVLVVAGFMYITSTGNPTMTSKAKDWIMNALIGLMIVFFAWLILNVINPDLTKIDDNLAEFKKMGKIESNVGSNVTSPGSNVTSPGSNVVSAQGDHGGAVIYTQADKNKWYCKKADGSPGTEGDVVTGNISNATSQCLSLGYAGIIPTPKEVQCTDGSTVPNCYDISDPVNFQMGAVGCSGNCPQ